MLFNGSNTAALSKAIYQRWLVKHAGTDRITGSPSADMRAALVDYFRDEFLSATMRSHKASDCTRSFFGFVFFRSDNRLDYLGGQAGHVAGIRQSPVRADDRRAEVDPHGVDFPQVSLAEPGVVVEPDRALDRLHHRLQHPVGQCLCQCYATRLRDGLV